jgi:hypothetical protein
MCRRCAFPDPRHYSRLLGCLAAGWLLAASQPLHADDPADGDTQLVVDLASFDPGMLARVIPPDPQRPLPFAPGEVLRYELGWGMFTVAESEIRVEATTHNDRPAWLITLTTRTNSFADSFYKVRNETRSWVDPAVTHTLKYTNRQNEGKRLRDIIVEFVVDSDPPTAAYQNLHRNEILQPVPIFANTFDPLAITWFFRTLPLAVGQEWIVPTTNGKEPFLTIGRVIRAENKRFKLGRHEVLLVEPDIKDVGGVFRRSKDGTIRFWFTNDERRLPIRMESSVSVGKFWAELVEIIRPE